MAIWHSQLLMSWRQLAEFVQLVGCGAADVEVVVVVVVVVLKRSRLIIMTASM